MIFYKPEQILMENPINPIYSSFFNQVSIPITTSSYSGNYIVLSKSGNESLYDVNIAKLKSGNSLICLEAGWDTKEVENIEYEIDSKTGDEKEIISKYNYSVPSTLSFYKTGELSKEADLIKTKTNQLSATSPINPNKFCYTADPNKDFYLKFGDNSVVVIQENIVSTNSILNNVTAETNFTHLNISTSAPYNSLVAYYPFDGDLEDTELTTHYDWSAYNNNGIGVGDAYVNNINCVYGDCAKFDDNADYIFLGNPSSLSLGGNFTISAWINAGSETDYQTIVSKGTASATRNYWFALYSNGYLAIAFPNATTGGTCNLQDNTNLRNAGWQYVVGGFNGTHCYVYLNGIFQASDPAGNPTITNHNATIGWQALSQAREFNGSIDEVMIFNTSLTSAQILAIYNNQSARFLATGTQDIINQSYMGIFNYCYQEYANQTTDCGGLNTGSYWTENYYFNINYSKPSGFTSADWKVKFGDISTYNVTIPSDCFALNPLQLRFYSYEIVFTSGTSYGQCKNATNWKNITQISSGDSGDFAVGGLNYPYDGNWDTAGAYADEIGWNDATGNTWSGIWEEGIYWKGRLNIVPYNRVNVTTYTESLLGSSINLTVGFYNTSNSWFYTTPQVVTSGAVQTFTISDTSTNLTLNYTFYAGNSTNPFYSPIIKNNISFEVWNVISASSCQELSTANTIYTLLNNVTSADTCFTIQANNITLDCNGYTINYSTSGSLSYGVYSIANFTIVKNCIFKDGDNTGSAIYFDGANNGTINNNIISTTGFLGEGIELYLSSNNTISDNIVITYGIIGYGIELRSSSINNVINNTVTTYGDNGHGIQFLTSNTNNLIANYIITFGSDTYGIILSSTSTNNIITNSNFSADISDEVFLEQNSKNNSFLNSTYSTESIDGTSSLIRKWYYQAYVNDTSGNNVANANITAYNTTGSVEFTGLMTNSSGWTNLTTITDYVNNGTRTYYSNYTIYAINSSYQIGSHTYNATEKQSNYKDIFTLALISGDCWTKTGNILYIPTGCIYQLNKGSIYEI